MSLARFPPFPLVPSLPSAAPVALKDKQAGEMASLPLSPAAGPRYQRALRGTRGTGGRLVCLSPSLCLDLLVAKHQTKAENSFKKPGAVPSQGSGSRRRIGEGTNELRVFKSLSAELFPQRPLCFSESVFQSLPLGFASPLLRTVSVCASQLSLSLSVLPASCSLCGPAPPLPTSGRPPPATAAPAAEHAGSREAGTGGARGPSHDPHSHPGAARGPVRARGGARAQPRPRRRRARDPGLILSW